MGWRRLRSRYNRLYYKRLHDWFYSETTYVRPKFKSLHRDSCVQFFSTKYHFKWANPKAGDTRDNVCNTLLSFTQQVGVMDELVTNYRQNVSGSGTKCAQILCDKDICHMLTETYRYWKNVAEVSFREILRLYEKKRIQKGVPKQLFTYLINWCCTTRNATALDIHELGGQKP